MQKKIMTLWQMIILVVLLAAVTISMFFPVLNPTGKKFVKYGETFMEKYQDDEKIGKKCKDGLKEIDDENERQKIIESFDDEFKDIKDISFPISGIQFITGSFWTGEVTTEIGDLQEKNEDELSDDEKEALDLYEKYNTKCNALRVGMIIVYFTPLIFIALYILAFCLHWNKNIMAIIGLCFSVIGLAITGIFYFITPYFIKNEAVDIMGSNYEDVALDAAKMIWKVFRGGGLLTTFILFLLILVMAIVTMAVGNSQQNDVVNGPSNLGGGSYSGGMGGYGDIPNGPGGYGNIPNGPGGYGDIPNGPGGFNGDIPGGMGNISGGNSQGGLNQFVTEQKPKKVVKQEPIPQPPVQQLGRVRCIEGNANVPGYKFPEENKIIVGANPTRCQIVINGAPHVSNIHCSIRYNAQKNTYIVKDHSSNGTFVNGARLPKDQAMEYPAGTILSLADGSNKLRLGD